MRQGLVLHARAAAVLLAALAVAQFHLIRSQDEEPVPQISPRLQQCLDLTTNAGSICTAESDTMSLIYYRDSSRLPTVDEATAAITRMKSAGQPSQSCCNAFRPYVEQRCPCDPEYQDVVPIGGYYPAYFEGATRILALPCRMDFPPCLPGGPSFAPPEANPAPIAPGG